MALDRAQHYLLKALDAFDRRVVVISPDFELLAVAGIDPRAHVDRSGGLQVLQSLLPAGRVLQGLPGQKGPAPPAIPPFAAGPIGRRRTSRAVSMPFPFLKMAWWMRLRCSISTPPLLPGLRAEMRRSHAFLQNLIRNASDPVIAADMTGRIIIFNEAAAECSRAIRLTRP